MDDRRQVEEILSWRLVTELWRRFPDRFMLVETHPGGGQYDCLTLLGRNPNDGALLYVNRVGSVHVEETANSSHRSWPDWTDRMLGQTPLAFLDEVTEAMGLLPPQQLPSSTATTIVYRFVSDFLTHSIGRLETWECRNGYADTSGWGGGEREEWFEKFPGVAEQAMPQRHADSPLSTAYYHWFLVKDGEPVLCLNTDGLVMSRAGETHQLLPLYRKKKTIWGLIAAVATNLMP